MFARMQLIYARPGLRVLRSGSGGADNCAAMGYERRCAASVESASLLATAARAANRWNQTRSSGRDLWRLPAKRFGDFPIVAIRAVCTGVLVGFWVITGGSQKVVTRIGLLEFAGRRAASAFSVEAIEGLIRL